MNMKILIWALTLLLTAWVVSAAAPNNLTLTFQLYNASTAVPLNGTHTVTAQAFAAVSGGSSVMNETGRIDFLNGVGHMLLNSNVSSLTISSQYWWSFQVAGGTATSPRIPDTPVRQAFWANNASWTANASYSIIAGNATFSGKSGNATFASTYNCADVIGATSNLCTLVDTDTDDSMKTALTGFGGNAGSNFSASSNTSAFNITGQAGGVITSVANNVISLVMAVANSIITSFTSLVNFAAGLTATTINTSVSVNATNFYGTLTGLASNATKASEVNCADITGETSNLCTLTDTDTNTGTGIAFTTLNGTQGSPYRAPSNDSSINWTIPNGNVSFEAGRAWLNFTDKDTIYSDTALTANDTILFAGGNLTGKSAGGDLTGTYPSPTITANAVALTTDTSGNYAQQIAGSGNIVVNGTAEEGSSHNVTIISNPSFINVSLTNYTTGSCITYWNGTCEVKQCLTSTLSIC